MSTSLKYKSQILFMTKLRSGCFQELVNWIIWYLLGSLYYSTRSTFSVTFLISSNRKQFYLNSKLYKLFIFPIFQDTACLWNTKRNTLQFKQKIKGHFLFLQTLLKIFNTPIFNLLRTVCILLLYAVVSNVSWKLLIIL